MKTLGLNQSKDIRIGDRVVMLEGHPWAGQAGIYIEDRKTQLFGFRPYVQLDNGETCFVMKDDQFEREKKS